ncbi:sensor histidine kinase [Paenibacillus guangzhouensis]|uniref:sensor histidine kinase n=1 Tax=Paenibacillus guangzhouensis TaxID=1473112 RepID=UPI001266AF98|nr:HAMP domain-containing sensor histidine kinase [Paenibacillus guangzhouensis]
MKLFIKEHLWIVVLYLVSFIGLVTVYHWLGGFEAGIGYFIFLNIFLLACVLIYRYFALKPLLNKLSVQPDQLDELLILEPRTSLEHAFARTMIQYRMLLSSEINQLERKQEDYRHMLDTWVHQMKTPVSVISLLSERNEENSDFQKVRVESRRLEYNLAQLLTYIRLDGYERDFKIDHIPLLQIVKEVVNELKPYFIARSVFPKVNIPEHVLIYSDKKWLKRALYQIMNNAIKYSDAEKSVHMTAVATPNGIELSVTNVGIGIKKSDIRRVFDKYYTGDTGREQGESSGIGLYMARQITTMLGHTIQVVSEPGHETTLTVTFRANKP